MTLDELNSGIQERLIEQRIVKALTSLGYPVPEDGMPMLKAMGLVADALEDWAMKVAKGENT